MPVCGIEEKHEHVALNQELEVYEKMPEMVEPQSTRTPAASDLG